MSNNQLEKINFIMLLAKSLHRYGASADRIENALKKVSEKLSIEADFFSLPTGIFASFSNEDSSQHTRLCRMAPGKVNLEKLYLVDKTVDFVLDEQISLEEGNKFIYEILNQKARYNDHLVMISYALIAASISLFLNGSWYDSLFSGIFGLVVGFFAESTKEERIDSIFDGLISFVVTIGSYFIYYLGWNISPSNVIVSSLIYLIPGLGLTMAISELASQNLTSGTARLMGAIIILLKISFGIFIANVIAESFNLVIIPPAPITVSLLIKTIALIVASIGLIISFQVRPQDSIWILIMCFLSYYSSQIFLLFVGATASSFLAGAVVGAFSNFFARILNRPALIFLLPAILLLVPGTIGYKSLNFMFADNPIEGIRFAFETFSIALALVSGIYFGNILIKPDRQL